MRSLYFSWCLFQYVEYTACTRRTSNVSERQGPSASWEATFLCTLTLDDWERSTSDCGVLHGCRTFWTFDDSQNIIIRWKTRVIVLVINPGLQLVTTYWFLILVCESWLSTGTLSTLTQTLDVSEVSKLFCTHTCTCIRNRDECQNSIGFENIWRLATVSGVKIFKLMAASSHLFPLLELMLNNKLSAYLLLLCRGAPWMSSLPGGEQSRRRRGRMQSRIQDSLLWCAPLQALLAKSTWGERGGRILELSTPTPTWQTSSTSRAGWTGASPRGNCEPLKTPPFFNPPLQILYLSAAFLQHFYN